MFTRRISLSRYGLIHIFLYIHLKKTLIEIRSPAAFFTLYFNPMIMNHNMQQIISPSKPIGHSFSPNGEGETLLI